MTDNHAGWAHPGVRSWVVRRDAKEMGRRSWRLWAAGEGTRLKLAEAFHDAVVDLKPGVEPGEAHRWIMRENAKLAGVPIGVILLLLNVAWSILVLWYERRHPV